MTRRTTAASRAVSWRGVLVTDHELAVSIPLLTRIHALPGCRESYRATLRHAAKQFGSARVPGLFSSHPCQMLDRVRRSASLFLFPRHHPDRVGHRDVVVFPAASSANRGMGGGVACFDGSPRASGWFRSGSRGPRGVRHKAPSPSSAGCRHLLGSRRRALQMLNGPSAYCTAASPGSGTLGRHVGRASTLSAGHRSSSPRRRDLARAPPFSSASPPHGYLTRSAPVIFAKARALLATNKGQPTVELLATGQRGFVDALTHVAASPLGVPPYRGASAGLLSMPNCVAIGHGPSAGEQPGDEPLVA